jgi:hypothetical protein
VVAVSLVGPARKSPGLAGIEEGASAQKAEPGSSANLVAPVATLMFYHGPWLRGHSPSYRPTSVLSTSPVFLIGAS